MSKILNTVLMHVLQLIKFVYVLGNFILCANLCVFGHICFYET